jgi:hypothetical protein
MVTLPEAIPATIPAEPTVATEVLLLLQVPPDVAVERATVPPEHTEDEPEIAEGSALTVSVATRTHPDADA